MAVSFDFNLQGSGSVGEFQSQDANLNWISYKNELYSVDETIYIINTRLSLHTTDMRQTTAHLADVLLPPDGIDPPCTEVVANLALTFNARVAFSIAMTNKSSSGGVTSVPALESLLCDPSPDPGPEPDAVLGLGIRLGTLRTLCALPARRRVGRPITSASPCASLRLPPPLPAESSSSWQAGPTAARSNRHTHTRDSRNVRTDQPST
ncbi:hypothetical protein N7517_003617 [Penicillium concentricum]|uniref:Uncharacterized protein n=1 Tax=Penicillium concentricum TaxID=293559 RepID=A0A9W9S410_9EURO|nr:uncharacterized protein N7517_003617 [Penicillium concentricum]KAJ5371611.1 hypothetical protein N7517_003617 [Penicillium concentricum]